MPTAIKQELAKALQDQVGLSTQAAGKAADTALRALTSKDWVWFASHRLLVSSRLLRSIRGSVKDRIDQPAFVNSIANLVAAATATSEQALAATTDVLVWSDEPLRAATVARVVRALAEVLRGVPIEVLAKAVAASSDLDALLTTLEAAELAAPDSAIEVASARARGIDARRQLLTMEGGPWTASRVARHLGITRQGVDRRRRSNKLLAVTAGKRGYLYPSWQFSHEGVLRGFESVTEGLAEHDAWSRVIFFLSPNSRLGGPSPLQALRKGEVDAVRSAASVFGEHGAA